MKRNDWVTDGYQLGQIRHVWGNGYIDIVLFDRRGNKLGRTSPPEGGPKDFEPCREAKDWKVIEPPRFPLKIYAHLEDLVVFKKESRSAKGTLPDDHEAHDSELGEVSCP